MSTPLEECETHVWLNRLDDVAYISTNIAKDKRYWRGKQDDSRVKSVSEDGDVLNLTVDKSALKIGLKAQRHLSEEQRQAAAIRLAEARGKHG